MTKKNLFNESRRQRKFLKESVCYGKFGTKPSLVKLSVLWRVISYNS